MRSTLCLVLALLAPPVLSQIVVPGHQANTVYLTGAAALERLRQTNPNHYAQALRIIGAANRLCRAGPGQLDNAAIRQPDLGPNLDTRNITCSAALLKTSNPAKFDITFQLQAIRYVATVTVTGDPARRVPAQDRVHP